MLLLLLLFILESSSCCGSIRSGQSKLGGADQKGGLRPSEQNLKDMAFHRSIVDIISQVNILLYPQLVSFCLNILHLLFVLCTYVIIT